MAKYQNEGLNIIAERYPNIDFSNVDGKSIAPVGTICGKLGINIIRTIFEVGYHGYYDPRTKTIFVNKRDPASRQRFTVAHELGHYILHKGTNNRYDEYHRYTPEEVKREFEANDFAAKLLMPVNTFVESFHRNNGILLYIAYEFGVSVRVCEVRAFNLELITNL